MNRINRYPPPPSASEALESRFAMRIVARLSEASEAQAPEIAERLRFAREQALHHARAARQAAATARPLGAIAGQAALVRGGAGPEASWWFKLAALLPLAVLIMGLIGIYDLHDRSQIDAAAQIDAELLADDLPPDAYRDPGFVEFLKAPTRD